MATDIVQVAVGSGHTCVRTESGAVECTGRIGDASGVNYGSHLTPVPGLAGDVIDLDSGPDHVCAVLDDGPVVCWGHRVDGSLGDDSQTTGGYVSEPVQVAGLPENDRAVEVSTGKWNGCARLASGALYCWGRNSFGQLGVDSTTSKYQATPVAGFSQPGDERVLGAEIGYVHMCLYTSERVYCTGDNLLYRQGDGLDGESSLVPTPVDNIEGPGITDLEVSNRSACVRVGVDLMCWGSSLPNPSGELPPHPSPVLVDDIFSDSVVDISLSTSSSITQGPKDTICAIVNGLFVECIGDPFLGNGTGNPSNFAQTVTGTLQRPTVSIDVGVDHSCSVTTTGEAWCWGRASLGQLSDVGDGRNGTTYVPVQMVRANS